MLGYMESNRVNKETKCSVPSDPKKVRSFAEVLLNGNANIVNNTQEEGEFVSLRPLSPPRMAWGNIVVEVDDEEYQKGVEEQKFSVTGKLILRRDDQIPTRWI